MLRLQLAFRSIETGSSRGQIADAEISIPTHDGSLQWETECGVCLFPNIRDCL